LPHGYSKTSGECEEKNNAPCKNYKYKARPTKETASRAETTKKIADLIEKRRLEKEIADY